LEVARPNRLLGGRTRLVGVEGVDDSPEPVLVGVREVAGVGGHVRDRSDDVVDDRDGRRLCGAGHGVKVDDDFGLAGRRECLGAVTVFQRDDHYVRGADAVGVDFRALVVQSGDAAVGGEAFHALCAVLAEVVGDGLHPLVGSVKEVDLDGRARRRCEVDRLAGDERSDVAVDGKNGTLGEQEVGGRGACCLVGAGERLLAEQIVEGLAAALCYESLPAGDGLLDALLDSMAGQKRLVTGVTLRNVDHTERESRGDKSGLAQNGTTLNRLFAPLEGMAQDAAGDEEETIAERGAESRLKLWLLMEANRWAVTLVLLVVVFGVLVAASELAPRSVRSVAQVEDPVDTVFQALVTSIITGVTLVVTITQLVLSQELGGVGKQRERVSDAMDFDEDLEETIRSDVAPAEPAALLQAIVDAAKRSARAAADAVTTGHQPAVRDRVQEFTDGVTENATDVSDKLESAEFGSFDVISAALDFNYSRKIHEVRRLQSDFEDDLSGEASDALDALLEQLLFFAAAREHVKTLYFRWELSNLSRAILYAALPALVVAILSILVLDATGVRGATLGVDNLVIVVSATTTVALSPFVLLVAYILRIVTVTKRTLAPGPLILRTRERNDGED